MSALATRAAGVAAGLALDGVLGEPPGRVHPVALFGAAMTGVEQQLWADRRANGVLYASLGVMVGWSSGRLLERRARVVGGTAAAVLIAAAGRALTEAAETVAGHVSAGDLAAARQALRSLVGRETQDLDEKEICRAVVESLAENLSDAVVASALWGLLGGPTGCLVHRAANTMDAMVGHRDHRYGRFGWASARLDDLLGWPSARVTALLVAAARPRHAGAVLRAWRADAASHPSPNAGVAEAAVAAALGVTLGGTNRYGERIETRPSVGEGPAPSIDDVARAVALVRQVTQLVTVVSALLAVVLVALGAAAGRSSGEVEES